MHLREMLPLEWDKLSVFKRKSLRIWLCCWTMLPCKGKCIGLGGEGKGQFVAISKIKLLSLQPSLSFLTLVTISLNGSSPKYRGIGITIHRLCLCVVLHRQKVTNLRTGIVNSVAEAVNCTLHCWQAELCVPLTLHVWELTRLCFKKLLKWPCK